MMKKCPRCNKRKKMSNFNIRKDTGKVINYCVLCDKAYHKVYRLKTKYGLDEKKYEALIEFQKGLCAICGKNTPAGRWHKWQIDHCHVDKHVRGVLCFNCNKHLGYYEKLAKQIERYLQNPPALMLFKEKIRGIPIYQ